MVHPKYTQYDQFGYWLRNDLLGRYLIKKELLFFQKMTADLFGFFALQVGLPEYSLLKNCRITSLISMGEGRLATLQAELTALPFSAESLDLIVLPHTLDFNEAPIEILREVTHLLMPGGHIVLTGFNPYSLWGLKRFFKKKPLSIPWSGAFFGLYQIKQWFRLVGLEIEMGRLMAYAPPIETIQPNAWIDKAGDRWWPMGAAVYGLRATKKAYNWRPLKPHLKWMDMTKPCAASDNKHPFQKNISQS